MYSILSNTSYLKLYTACRLAHAAMDALLQAWPVEGQLDSIDEIVVETYPAAIRLAGIKMPGTASAARFSIPFTLALGLKYRDAAADRYTEVSTQDPVLKTLAQKVKLVPDKRWEQLYPAKRGANVTVSASGQTFCAEVELAKGEPENPASWEEIQTKFIKNSTMFLPPERSQELALAISEVERLHLRSMTDHFRRE